MNKLMAATAVNRAFEPTSIFLWKLTQIRPAMGCYFK